MTAQTTRQHVHLNIYGYNTIGKQLGGPIILAVMMFLAAGTTDWFWGWVFTIVHFLAWLLMTVVVLRENPELFNARGKVRKGAKSWDMILLALYGIDWIALLLLGGLDVRYGM